MENIIQKHRAFVAGQIQKSFDSSINLAEETDLEKAHYDGEVHPNGKWVWVSSANGGKGDWRTKGGRTHNAHSENEKKFKQNFKNAQDGILQKIVDGKIQAGAHEKKWAQDILNERKKDSVDNKAAAKIIDLIKTSNNKYSDISKVVAFKTNKDNWVIDYDGADIGLIIDKNYLSEADLKAAGVKIEGANANSKKDSDLINDIKSNEDAFVDVCGLSDIKRVVSIRETPTSVFIKYENKSGQEQEFPLTKNIANLVLKEVKAVKSTMSGNKSDKKKADLPFTGLTKHSQVIDYAKTINGADFEEIDSGWGDKNSKAFRLNYNAGSLKLDVDFLNNSEYVYTFKDKNDNPLYEVRSTRQNDETDWSVMLNPRKWANLVKSNISKHTSRYKSEQTRYYNLYNRSGKNSYYDKYLNAKSAIDRFNRSLNKVDKILQLS